MTGLAVKLVGRADIGEAVVGQHPEVPWQLQSSLQRLLQGAIMDAFSGMTVEACFCPD